MLVHHDVLERLGKVLLELWTVALQRRRVPRVYREGGARRGHAGEGVARRMQRGPARAASANAPLISAASPPRANAARRSRAPRPQAAARAPPCGSSPSPTPPPRRSDRAPSSTPAPRG